jgi:superfamily II DNA or RNA helicase
MKLRDYQTKACEHVMEEWKTVDSTLVVLPTGTGKTVLAASIVKRLFPMRALFLAHREELIFQAKDKIQRVTGLSVGIEMADYRVDENEVFSFKKHPVIVSSIQTQNSGGDGAGRMGKFNPEEFGVIILDESHHSVSKSWRRVIDYYRTNPNVKILGITATPDRADEEALGQVYESVAFDYEILDAIEDGWLVPIRQRMVEIEDLNFSNIHTTAGDLNGGELAEVMEYEKNLHGVASATLEIAGTRKTLVFASSVKHAERLSEIFNRHRENCSAWVCGKTDKDERRRLLADFADNKIQFMCNVGCLTEGFDDPSIELVVMGRPTKSRSLYAQMIGRGTRPLPGIVDYLDSTADCRRQAIAGSGKQSIEIVDFCGNSGKHKLMTSADILGGKVSEEVVERAVKAAKDQKQAVDMTELIKEEARKLKDEKDRDAARRMKLMARAKFESKFINPFDVFNISPRKERGWDKGRELSEKQKGILEKQGIDTTRPYHECKQLLDEIFRRWSNNLCSYKQAKILQKHGYSGDVSRDEAKQLIDALARNGWRRPNAA